MKFNKVVVVLCVSVIVIACALVFANKAIQAQGEGATGEILNRIDDIARDQKAILDGINSIKEELKIIKIRVTQSQ